MSLRVLLADDHGIVLGGIRSVLERAGMKVIAEAKDGREAVKIAAAEAPDLVLMDISMPGMNGIEATRQITAERPGVKVLCVSMHSDSKFVTAALESGARGYLLKERAVEELLGAIRTVMAGRTFVCPQIAGSVTRSGSQTASGVATWSTPQLTGREREVLQLIAEGHSNKSIADLLCVSTKTVSTHRQNIMNKLNIHNAAGLTRYAIRRGVTSETGHAPSANP